MFTTKKKSCTGQINSAGTLSIGIDAKPVRVYSIEVLPDGIAATTTSLLNGSGLLDDGNWGITINNPSTTAATRVNFGIVGLLFPRGCYATFTSTQKAIITFNMEL